MRQLPRTSLTVVFLLVGLVGPLKAGWDEGVAAFKAGDLNTAASEFQQVVDQQPDWPGGHYMLGQVLLKLNRSQDALTHLRRAYDLNPNDLSVQMALGKAYLDLRRYADAASLLGKIDQSKVPSQQQGTLYQMLAVALEKTGQDDRALAELAKAARVRPNDATVQFQYGASALNAGDTAAAVVALEKASRLDANDNTKLKVYAQALLRQGRTTTGSGKGRAYTKCAATAKSLVARDASYENLMLLGDANLGSKQYDQAIAAYEQAVGKNAADWLPQYYIGQAYTVKQQYRSAEAVLKQSLDKASRDADKNKIWKQLAFVYEKQKNYGDAVAAYRRAGDPAGAQRAEENRVTAAYNEKVEAEAEEIRRLQEEQDRIKEQLKELPGGPPPF